MCPFTAAKSNTKMLTSSKPKFVEAQRNAYPERERERE